MNAFRQWLLVRPSQQENAFGPCLQEILRAEGLSGFRMVNLDEGLPELRADDLIVLTRCFLRNDEIERLRAAVEAGARLVVLHPSVLLAHQFGWEPQQRAVYPGWVQVGAGSPGHGLPLQTHLPIAAFTCSDAETLAGAVDAAWNDAGCPAVARRRFGKGAVVLFFYDLPKAVARLRFGDPELAAVETSEQWHWTHASDLFAHCDDRVLDRPQADFHGQLLAKILTDISPYPLARTWYYEKIAQRSAVVFSSDDDWSTPDQFKQLSDALVSHGGVATFYLVKDTHLSDEEIAALRALGHTFAPHVHLPDGEELAYAFPKHMEEETRLLKARLGSLSVSLQMHRAPWLGYMTWVPDFIRYGFRLLMSYLSLPPQNVNRYLCGSGRPLKFVDQDGAVHDCWQQPVLSYDDQTLIPAMTADPQAFVRKFAEILRPAMEEHHTTLGMASHPVSYATYSKPFFDALLDLIVAEGVPIYNGDGWCAFNDRRNAVQIEQSQDGDALTCTVRGLVGELPLMLPVTGPATVTVNGQPAEGIILRRLGQEYLCLQLNGDGTEIVVAFDS
ncbi:MAG: polysaccharide deacetylase family protein [Armatimonadota bacterium]